MTVVRPSASGLLHTQMIRYAAGCECACRAEKMFTRPLMAQEPAVCIIDVNDAHNVAASLLSALQALRHHLPIHHQLQDFLLLAKVQSTGPQDCQA